MTRRWLAVLAVLATATAWGMTFPLVKDVLVRVHRRRIDHPRRQLRGLPHLLQDGSGRPGEDRGPGADLPLPVPDERSQAELCTEGKSQDGRGDGGLRSGMMLQLAHGTSV